MFLLDMFLIEKTCNLYRKFNALRQTIANSLNFPHFCFKFRDFSDCLAVEVSETSGNFIEVWENKESLQKLLL